MGLLDSLLGSNPGLLASLLGIGGAGAQQQAAPIGIPPGGAAPSPPGGVPGMPGQMIPYGQQGGLLGNGLLGNVARGALYGLGAAGQPGPRGFFAGVGAGAGRSIAMGQQRQAFGTQQALSQQQLQNQQLAYDLQRARINAFFGGGQADPADLSQPLDQGQAPQQQQRTWTAADAAADPSSPLQIGDPVPPETPQDQQERLRVGGLPNTISGQGGIDGINVTKGRMQQQPLQTSLPPPPDGGSYTSDQLAQYRDLSARSLREYQLASFMPGFGHSNERAKQLAEMAVQSLGYKSAAAFAEAKAKALGTPLNLRQGSTAFDLASGKPIYTAPVLGEGYDPGTGRMVPVQRTPTASGVRVQGVAPDAGAGSQGTGATEQTFNQNQNVPAGYYAAPSKEDTKVSEDLGEEGGVYRKGKMDALPSNLGWAKIKETASHLYTGPYAPTLEKVQKMFFPLLGPEAAKSVTNYQELYKLTTKQSQMDTMAMGSREAAQVFNIVRSSNPSNEMTRQAIYDLSNAAMAINDYKIAVSDAREAWRQQHGTASGFTESPWVSSMTPMTFFALRLADKGTGNPELMKSLVGQMSREEAQAAMALRQHQLQAQ